MSSDAQIRHIYEQWHKTLMSQDLAGLMALYAEHAVFESPTVLAQFPERDDGILRGHSEIEKLRRTPWVRQQNCGQVCCGDECAG